MKQISSKVKDQLPPDPEVAITAFEKRTSRPPPFPKARKQRFELMVEEFMREVIEKSDLFHQK